MSIPGQRYLCGATHIVQAAFGMEHDLTWGELGGLEGLEEGIALGTLPCLRGITPTSHPDAAS
jgi:hypothetical protein